MAEAAWVSVTSTFSSERDCFVWGTFALHEAHFVLFNLFFGSCDFFGWLQRYRIQGTVYPPPELLAFTVVVVLFNHFCVQLPGLMMIWPVVEFVGGWPLVQVSAPLPSFATVAWQLVFSLLVEDTMFYWTHRALHHRFVYRHVHKLHHRYTTPVVIATEFAHPIEYFVANSAPVLMGPLLLCGTMHCATWWFWLIIRLSEAVDGHCGYELPFSPFGVAWPLRPSGAEHDWHHSKNVGNFGSLLVLWDEICGTSRRAYLERTGKKGNSGADDGGTAVAVVAGGVHGKPRGQQPKRRSHMRELVRF